MANVNENYYDLDYLTGLVSRRGLYDYYASLDKSFSIHALFVDIDNFKRVNDVYGHSMGDQLLIAVSNLIKTHTSECKGGFTARIGGDEYVLLMDASVRPEDVEELAKKMLSHLETMDFRKDILSLISLSIGIVFNQSVSQILDDILAKCDAAMYQSKYDGKNRYTIYRSYDKTLEINRNIELEMYDALDNGQFQVYLQPKVNMVSSELYGAEALSRWVHPVDGLRRPDMYIPLFEKNGFISKLDMYVYEEVCKLKASWSGEKYANIPISVNMSRLHLYNKEFPEILESIAYRYGVPTNELEIEITESTFIKDNAELIRMIDRLQEKGFSVSIDDFGSGFSALNLLKDLSVNTIKIDREFLRLSSNNSRGKKVIRNIIAMCLDLKMDVVTEGIETKEQIDFITRCGCQIAQGFYYSKPIPVDEFIVFADEYLSNIHASYRFPFNGDTCAEDCDMIGFLSGEGFTYEDGIFEGCKSIHLPGGEPEKNTIFIPNEAIVNDSFSVSVWLKPEIFNAWISALYIKFESGFCSIIPNAFDGLSSLRIRDSKEVNGWYDVTGLALNQKLWYHYSFSYNAKTETATAFLNGEVLGVLENVPTNRYVKWIILGGDVFQPSFVGNICELVIYNEAKDHLFMKELHQQYISREDFTGFIPIDK